MSERIDVLTLSDSEFASDQSDPLLSELQRRKGDTTYVSFAAEIGQKESMLRAYMSGRSDAGLDTLSVLMAWDSALEPLIMQRLRSRGQEIRDRLRSQSN